MGEGPDVGLDGCLHGGRAGHKEMRQLVSREGDHDLVAGSKTVGDVHVCLGNCPSKQEKGWNSAMQTKKSKGRLGHLLVSKGNEGSWGMHGKSFAGTQACFRWAMRLCSWFGRA